MVEQPQVREEWGVTVSATGELLRRDRVEYPESAYKNGIEGTVMVEATLDREGSVSDARVLSGPPELRKAALESVLQWRFANGRAGETQQVGIAFQKDARAQAQGRSQNELAVILFLEDEIKAARERGDSQAMQGLMGLQMAQITTLIQSRNPTLEEERARIENLRQEQADMVRENQLLQLNQQLEDARKRGLTERHPQIVALMAQMEALRKQVEHASLVGARLGQIEIRGVPDSARAELGARLSIGVGEILTEVSMRSAIAAIHEFDQRLECRFIRAGNGDAVLRISGPE
jgi:TonB family protein